MPTVRERATLLYECGSYDKALLACQEGLAAEPGAVFFLGIQAICEHCLGRYPQAESTARYGLSLQAEDVVCLRILALTLAATSRFEEAEELAQKAIAVSPTDARSWLIAAQVALNWGKNELAAERAEKALALGPELKEARTLLVTARTDAGMASKQEVLEFLSHYPESSQAHRNLGWLELLEGRLEQAEKHFAIALANAPEERVYCHFLLAARRCGLPLLGPLQLGLLRALATLERRSAWSGLMLLLISLNLVFVPDYPLLPVLLVSGWMLRPVGNLLVAPGPLMVGRERLEAWLVVTVALTSLLLLVRGWSTWHVLGLFLSIVPLILGFSAREHARASSFAIFALTATLALLQLPGLLIPVIFILFLAACLLGTSMVQV